MACKIRVNPSSVDAQCSMNRKLFPLSGYSQSVTTKKHTLTVYRLPRVCAQLESGKTAQCSPDSCAYPEVSLSSGTVGTQVSLCPSPLSLPKSRQSIERLFGRMKTRWRTFFFQGTGGKTIFSVRCYCLLPYCITSACPMETLWSK